MPLAAAFVLFGGGLACGAWSLGHAPVAVTAVPIAVAGVCVPLLTGGLSSQLTTLVRPDQRALSRAEGRDAPTYGLAATVGPTMVLALAGPLGLTGALLALGAVAATSATFVALLPSTAHSADGGGWPTRRLVGLLLAAGPLRRVMVATALNELGTCGLAVVAVVLGARAGDAARTGTALAAVYGAGNLLGSVTVALFPMRGEPEQLALRCMTAVGVAVALCAAAPTVATTVAAFALAGAAQAALVTASFSVRSTYAPPRARAQVFVSIAGFKMASGAAGVALTGQLLFLGARPVLATGAALSLLAVATAVLDRHRTS